MAAEVAAEPPGAIALRERLASGALRATELMEALLARTEALEPSISAWAWLDREEALRQAKALDAWRASGRAIGPLHGLPVGLKDIIDVAGMPGENGCPLDAGRRPNADAWLVTRLRAAGALVMGKTVTTELAYMHAGRTRNPHDPERTPGGSSSGSAAAVAAGMVPLAVGTQTGGSVIRPAAFCGVVGYKPSFGAIPRTGVLMQSHTLDTVGLFARDVEGAALLADCLFGHDERDAATRPAPPPRLLETARSAPPLPPVVAFVRPPGWEDRAEPATKAAFAELVARLGERCFDAALPAPFEEAATLRRRINFAEMAHHYRRYARSGIERLGQATREALEEGAATSAADYLAALDWREPLYAGIAQILARADAILCPAATGPAPKGLAFTGDPIFNGLWTWLGTPAITLPALASPEGAPMGVQLVGARGDDGRLLRTANALWRELGG